MSECAGYCCAVFTFTSTPAQIRERIAEKKCSRDDPMLADMLIPLSFEDAQARAAEFHLPSSPAIAEVARWTEDTPLYTCKHWDETTRLCTIYESRPMMCRDFPYGRECGHGCGFCNADDPTVMDRYVTTETQGGDAHAQQDT
jgi:Fe-S-cluster containining protein